MKMLIAHILEAGRTKKVLVVSPNHQRAMVMFGLCVSMSELLPKGFVRKGEFPVIEFREGGRVYFSTPDSNLLGLHPQESFDENGRIEK